MSDEDKSDDRLLADLDDADEAVRAAAAAALARRSHPLAMKACLRTLNDAAELTHAYSTPAVWALVEIGPVALPPLLDRMLEDDPMTRLRAGFAAMNITKRRFGYDGLQWPSQAYERWASWWQDIGYEYDADAAARATAVSRLRAASAGWR